MNKNIAQFAVMTFEKGEEIFAGYTTEHIQQVGIYKLLAKQKLDGTIDWAHFVQRDNGLKEKVLRGTVNTPAEFNLVLDAVNSNLLKIFGVSLKVATYDVRSAGCGTVSNTTH
ncbi:MAG: hypothetical protein JJE30_06110 [Desulfuromonadales bacterium]|nr:hypothetical protein [Desulfuromonadales bacterium]